MTRTRQTNIAPLYNPRERNARRRRRLVGAGLTLALATCGLVFAQEAPSAEPQANGAEFKAPPGFTVLVDAVVTDKRNHVLSDLTKDDFLIYEDDVPQTIDAFQLVSPEGEEVADQPVLPAQPMARAEPSLGRRRNLIVFLLDYATTKFENQKLVEDACRRYIEENLRPDDLVAIFSLSSSFKFLQDFTGDKSLLLAALSRGDARGTALASSNPAPAVPQGARGADLSNPPTPANTPAAGAAAQAGGSSQADLMLAQRIQSLYYVMSSFLNRRQGYSVLSAIQAVSQGVREVEGRKTLILFSQGFVVGPNIERDLEKTIGLANRANVAIYGVDSQGLAPRELSGALVPSSELSSISAQVGKDRILASGGESLFDRAKQVGSDVRDSSLRYVSAATGGFAIRNSNDLYLSMERIDQDLRSYYLLSYRPANPTFDGKFKNIRVEVKRKDAMVRARSGYLAVPAGMELVSGEEYDLLREIQTGQASLDLPVSFRVEKLYDDTGGQIVLLALQVPASEVRFQEVKSEAGQLHEANLSIIGLIRNEEGKVVNRFGAPLNLSVPESEWTTMKTSNLSFTNAIQLEPGSYSFDVVVRDIEGERNGRVETALRLPAPTADLRLSSIVLGSEVRPGDGSSGTLSHGGFSVVPSAERTFDAKSSLIYYFDICGYKTNPAGSPNLEVKMSLARSGSSGKVPLEPYRITESDGASTRLSAAKYIELANLPPGSYFLRANVTDLNTGRSVRATTSFQIRN